MQTATLLVSVLALVAGAASVVYTAFMSNHAAKANSESNRATRSAVEQRLVDRAFDINRGWVEFKVRSPYAHILKISDGDCEKFTGKTIMLLQQLSLLNDVYKHKDLLDPETVKGYTHWATRIVQPWMRSDEQLKRVWSLYIQEKDWADRGFHEWLQPLMKASGDPS